MKSGEVLVQLDDSDLRAGERQAAENLKVVESALQLAIKSYKRQKIAAGKKCYSKKDFRRG